MQILVILGVARLSLIGGVGILTIRIFFNI